MPPEAVRRRSIGMEDMGRDTVFPFIEARLRAVWASVYQLVQRLALWLPYVLLLFVPATLDGLVVRRIKQEGFAYASPVSHRCSLYGFLLLGFLVLIGLVLPVAIPPLVLPLLAAGMALCLGLMMAHTQKRL